MSNCSAIYKNECNNFCKKSECCNTTKNSFATLSIGIILILHIFSPVIMPRFNEAGDIYSLVITPRLKMEFFDWRKIPLHQRRFNEVMVTKGDHCFVILAAFPNKNICIKKFGYCFSSSVLNAVYQGINCLLPYFFRGKRNSCKRWLHKSGINRIIDSYNS